jgi:hypothetical protein
MRYILTSNDKPMQLLRFVPRTPENHLTTDGRSYSDAELNRQFNDIILNERGRFFEPKIGDIPIVIGGMPFTLKKM